MFYGAIEEIFEYKSPLFNLKEKKTFGFCMFLVVFRHMVFVDGFLILVKELGLLTNLGQWIRGLDAVGSIYVYCIVNNENMMNRILEV
jgi:hypothetical protein